VVSPPYACQFVFVTNDVAVLKETYWVGAESPTGFKGRCCWKRITKYVKTIDIALNHRTHDAYRRQVCSAHGSTPIRR
jgi:hypothetical protein